MVQWMRRAVVVLAAFALVGMGLAIALMARGEAREPGPEPRAPFRMQITGPGDCGRPPFKPCPDDVVDLGRDEATTPPAVPPARD
jgi:hypothetical protein